MADLSDLQSSLSVKITGANPSSGIEDNFMEVDSSGRVTVRLNDGSGVSINLGQTTMSASVPVVIASDQTAIPVANFPTTVNTNYGTVGASTIRTAAQVGNATGAADFNAGATSAQTLRVTANQGTANATPWNENVAQFGGSAVVTGTGASGAGIPRVTVSNDSNILATQSGTWTTGRTWTLASGTDSVSVVQSTSPWVTKDQSDGPVTPGAVASFSQLMGGQFNTALPALTNTQQSAIQLDSSGRLIVSPTTQGVLAEDHNYGTVGASTLRVASQIGNATGAADFNFGAVGAQTLRTAAQMGNATGAALFGAGTTTAQVLRVVLPTDQTAIPATQSGTWTVQPGNTQNTTAWLTQDAADGPVTPGAVASKSILIGAQFNTTLPTLTNTQQAAIQVDSRGRLIVIDNSMPATVDTNYGTVGASTIRTASQIGSATGAADFNAGATGAQTLRTVANQGAPNTHANAWFARLTDNTNDSKLSANNDLFVRDSINTSGQYRAQSVTTSAAEALGAGTILVNRKSLTMTPTNGTIYWGFSNAVTTSSGTPIFKNQTVTINATDNVHIYVIAGSTIDCRIAEGS